MSKRICPLDGRLTTCPYNCDACLEEEKKEKERTNNANINS